MLHFHTVINTQPCTYSLVVLELDLFRQKIHVNTRGSPLPHLSDHFHLADVALLDHAHLLLLHALQLGRILDHLDDLGAPLVGQAPFCVLHASLVPLHGGLFPLVLDLLGLLLYVAQFVAQSSLLFESGSVDGLFDLAESAMEGISGFNASILSSSHSLLFGCLPGPVGFGLPARYTGLWLGDLLGFRLGLLGRRACGGSSFGWSRCFSHFAKMLSKYKQNETHVLAACLSIVRNICFVSYRLR